LSRFTEALSSAEEVISTLIKAPNWIVFKMTLSTHFWRSVYCRPLIDDFIGSHPKIELDFHLTNRGGRHHPDEGYTLLFAGCDE